MEISNLAYIDAAAVRIDVDVTLDADDVERLRLGVQPDTPFRFTYDPSDDSPLVAEIAAVIAATQPEIAAYAPPPPMTDAEKAATIRLRRAAFFVALDAALGLTPADALPEDHVAAAIAASALPDATKRLATILVRTAGEFLRDDPEAPGLMDAVGGALGLTPGQIDALFLSAAGG